MKKNGVIIVAYHKKYFSYSDEFFLPIHVGAATSNSTLEYIKDNTGENISEKNKNFCELTGIFWEWKNIDANFYGLMHYRRYLMIEDTLKHKIKRGLYYIGRKFDKDIIINKINMPELYQIKTTDENYVKEKIMEFSKKLPKLMKKYDIILPKKEHFSKTVYEQYKNCHIIEHLDLLLEIIKEKYPKMHPYFDKMIKKGKFSYCTNMFVMKKDYFDEYSQFMFDILFELEKRIEIPSDPYQSRVFGFLSERLMAPFIYYLIIEKNISTKDLNILFLDK